MGRPKPMLLWGVGTLVEHQIRCLVDGGCDEVVVVLGRCAEEVSSYVRGPSVEHTVNPNYAEGKTTSIKAGLRVIDPSAEAIMLLAVDQPRTVGIVSTVIRSHRKRGTLITSPRFQGHGGHPLIFDASLKVDLEAITEERQGIREVFQRHRDEVNEVPINDPMIRLDINTPEQYEEARARYGSA